MEIVIIPDEFPLDASSGNIVVHVHVIVYTLLASSHVHHYNKVAEADVITNDLFEVLDFYVKFIDFYVKLIYFCGKMSSLSLDALVMLLYTLCNS